MRKALASIAVALLLSLTMSTGARADDAASLLAKHRAFVGWQYGDGSVVMLKLARTYTSATGKITQIASESRVGLVYRRDYRALRKYEAGESTGFTGKVFWKTNQNGFTVPMQGDTAQYFLALDALFMEGTPELPSTMHGSGTIDGKTYPVVRVTMNGASPIDLYIDPDTGAYAQVVVDPGGSQETTIVIHSYTDLGNGKKFIGSWSLGEDKGFYSYTKAELGASIGDADLHPPQPSATWTFANAQPFPIKVTDSRLYVDATINGTRGRFIIDTGAAEIALTDDFANRAHVQTVDRSQNFGVGGDTKSLVRKVDSIVIGGNTLSNVVVSSLNMQFDDKSNFEKPDGLLGFDLFAGAIVDLNLTAGSMTIHDPSTTTADGRGGYPFTPDLVDGIPVVHATVDGHFDFDAMLDTGANGVILSMAAQGHGVALFYNAQRTFLGGNARASGVGGSEIVRCGSLGRIQVGPFPYTGLEACESNNWSLHNGLIGFDFLKHFDYVFDYPHDVLYLIPHKD